MAMPAWLTCELAEELQQATSTGQKIESFVKSLQHATLPALLEYGCAKWYSKDLPPIPQVIRDSTVGRALQEVRSDLGLRSSGPQKTPPRSIDSRDCEFYVLEGSDSPTTNDQWFEFLVRLRQSIKNVGFDMNAAKGISAAFGEMADNATIHSDAPVGVLVGYQVVAGAVVCCVAAASRPFFSGYSARRYPLCDSASQPARFDERSICRHWRPRVAGGSHCSRQRR